MNFFTAIRAFFTQDVGIDLGTANTVVHVRGEGIVIQEPSVVARSRRTGDVVAIGVEAKRMMGKTPEAIEVVRPLRDGVIADFDAAEALLTHEISQVMTRFNRFPIAIPYLTQPRVVIGIPSGVTEVERRAVRAAAISAGAYNAYLVEEPMAAAIGAGLKVEEPEGRMVVDIGGGTTEIAVISLGGIVLNKSLRVAGDEFDEAVMTFARMRHGLVIGDATAEQTKIAIGSASQFEVGGFKRAGIDERLIGVAADTFDWWVDDNEAVDRCAVHELLCRATLLYGVALHPHGGIDKTVERDAVRSNQCLVADEGSHASYDSFIIAEIRCEWIVARYAYSAVA
jgi:MreB/Mrl family cell shape determining protein